MSTKRKQRKVTPTPKLLTASQPSPLLTPSPLQRELLDAVKVPVKRTKQPLPEQQFFDEAQ